MNKIHLASALFIISLSSCKKTTSITEPIPTEKKWRVSTLAGTGLPGFANGLALAAQFQYPVDVAVSTEGSFYITDIFNYRIRKINGGHVVTFAGGSGTGILDGSGTVAEFIEPFSITADSNGNLFTTDGSDPRIRKITSFGSVSTFAGSGAEGHQDGDPVTAQFGNLNFVTADKDGNIYVADLDNRRIRKVSTSGQVSTIAGTGETGFKNGNAGEAQFSYLRGLAVDTQGNVYVLDRGNYRIRKITPQGIVSTFAGTGVPGIKDGSANEAKFSDMNDVVINDKGNLFVSDNNRIRKIDSNGTVSTIAGSTAGFVDGDGLSAKFNFPIGLGIDALGNIYVADVFNHRIRKISFE